MPVDRLYIEANFKEAQLALMRPGQPVAVLVGALDGVELPGGRKASPGHRGEVLHPPPQDATGNFTKIVQRVPVRFPMNAGPTARRLLVPGLSVEVTVDTRSPAKSVSGSNRRRPRASGAQCSRVGRRFGQKAATR